MVRHGTEPVQLLTWDALMNAEQPPSLIEGILPAGSLALLSGPTGFFKSFIAVHMSLCLATGRAFYAHPVRCGQVVYVAAEGGWGLRKRARAWALCNGVARIDNFVVIPHPVNLRWGTDGASAVLDVLAAGTIAPILIVVDTLSQCFAGGDENAPADMTAFITALRLLRTETGASVLVVHHSAKSNASSSRGHSSLEGAVDVHYVVNRDFTSPDDRDMTLSCQKVRDDANFTALTLRGKSVRWVHDGTGHSESSLVLELLDDGKITGLPEEIRRLLRDDAWHTASELGDALGCTQDQLRRPLEEVCRTNRVRREKCDGQNGRRGTWRYRQASPLQAIETYYQGCKFRSRVEARWAVFMDTVGVRWVHEREGFHLGLAGDYLPDFWLPDLDSWLEIKPAVPTAAEHAKAQALAKRTDKKVFMFFDCAPSQAGWVFDPEGGVQEGLDWNLCSGCNHVRVGPCGVCTRGKQVTTSEQLRQAWRAAQSARFERDIGFSVK